MKIVFINQRIGFIFFLFQLMACHDKSSLKENLKSNCFWDLLDKRISNFPINSYKFYKNDKVDYFVYVFSRNSKTDFVEIAGDGDNIRPKNWSLEGDSILKFQGYKMEVLRYNSDSIFLNFINHNDLIVLIKNCKTIEKK